MHKNTFLNRQYHGIFYLYFDVQKTLQVPGPHMNRLKGFAKIFVYKIQNSLVHVAAPTT